MSFVEIRRAVAGVCAVAGIAVLAGPGWALLAAAVLLWLSPMPQRLSKAAERVTHTLGVAWRWISGSRRAVAVASMPAAIALAVAGIGVSFGVGAAMVAAGVGLGGVSLLSGWNI